MSAETRADMEALWEMGMKRGLAAGGGGRQMPECKWTQDEDGNWWTQCDNGFVFTDGGPADNEMRFCCYCGGKLLQCSYQESADESDT